MDNSINKFEKELDRLLEQYLGDGELKRLNLKINPPKEGNNNIPGMINAFYKSQLQIENNNYSRINYLFETTDLAINLTVSRGTSPIAVIR